MYKFLNKKTGGFTITELLVTASIFVIITTIVVVKNAQFNSSISLTSLAYEMALQVREAQSYGVSVREFGTGSGNFDRAYGVYFSVNTPDSFIFFADDDGDKSYDIGGVEEIDLLSIKGGNEILKFCATPTGGAEVCSDSGAGMTSLVVLFERPDPDAIISTDRPGNIPGNYTDATVSIVSPNGAVREVYVRSTGQIGIRK